MISRRTSLVLEFTFGFLATLLICGGAAMQAVALDLKAQGVMQPTREEVWEATKLRAMTGLTTFSHEVFDNHNLRTGHKHG